MRFFHAAMTPSSQMPRHEVQTEQFCLEAFCYNENHFHQMDSHCYDFQYKPYLLNLIPLTLSHFFSLDHSNPHSLNFIYEPFDHFLSSYLNVPL